VFPLRIAIDAMPLLVRSAGVKNYLYHWSAHLERAASADVSIELFPWLGRPRRLRPLNHESSQVGPLDTWASLALFHFFNLPGNPTLDWFERADVFHCSRLRNPPRRPLLTATLYDLTCWIVPEFHTPANVAWDRSLAETVWKRTHGLIAISSHTRDEAAGRLGLDARRIRVIPCGVDAPFFAAGVAEADAARARYGLKRPYALTVGSIEPRKNLDMALDVWASLSPELRKEFDFVVAGPEGWRAGQTVRRLRAAPAGVRYLGYVPEAGLPGLTAGAALLFYPSLYEGFGLPVAQAMACGVAVLTSNVSALPETAGEGALYADPRSAGELRAALERLLLSAELRRKLGAAGRQRAARYRWEEAARQSLQFFEELSR
jgi:glycosyltransferase involved in cell wall biosynthesis